MLSQLKHFTLKVLPSVPALSSSPSFCIGCVPCCANVDPDLLWFVLDRLWLYDLLVPRSYFTMSSYIPDIVVGYSSLSRRALSLNLSVSDLYLDSSAFLRSRIALFTSSSVEMRLASASFLSIFVRPGE